MVTRLDPQHPSPPGSRRPSDSGPRLNAERRRGERAWEDIQRLRKDTQVFEDIFGLRSSRVPIKAIVADLDNERDPGLKDAIRRVLRAFDR